MKQLSLPLKYWLNMVLILLCIVFFVVQYLNYRFSQNIQAEQFQKSISVIKLNVQTMMMFPVITKDQKEVARLASLLLSLDIVWDIEIKNHFGHIFYRAQKDGLETDIPLTNETIPLVDNTVPVALNNFNDGSESLIPGHPDFPQIGKVVISYQNSNFELIRNNFIKHAIVSASFMVLLMIVQVIITSRLNHLVQQTRKKIIQIQDVTHFGISELNEINQDLSNIHSQLNLLFEKQAKETNEC